MRPSCLIFICLGIILLNIHSSSLNFANFGTAIIVVFFFRSFNRFSVKFLPSFVFNKISSLSSNKFLTSSTSCSNFIKFSPTGFSKSMVPKVLVTFKPGWKPHNEILRNLQDGSARLFVAVPILVM
uniref:Putative secreted protein n=1 Tax=Panstrongylus lignarius TaxID=156445 RepID=A0A224XWQ6_9HEMI